MQQLAMFGAPAVEILPRKKRAPGETRRAYRKCRTRRLTLATLTREEETFRRQVDLEDVLEPLPTRPRRRSECANVPRPCPFVTCRYGMYLDADPETGAITLNFPDREPDEMPAECSCALDIAESGIERDCEELGKLLNVTGERVRQILVGALRSSPRFATLARTLNAPD